MRAASQVQQASLTTLTTRVLLCCVLITLVMVANYRVLPYMSAGPAMWQRWLRWRHRQARWAAAFM